MTSPAAEQRDGTDSRAIEFPVTATTQRALHEAIGHLYDELAVAREANENGAELPDELFEQIERFYTASADESVSSVELTYRLETRERRE
ncbi:hypothetical protein [Natronorubrum halophilum]|uniref:hypothetical protein n=1 Tax=Natronorubrum halophilum TaxID=1702106 RepID=UPI0010C201C7|nr:hypothetical protein [Natronorubrum halophilum]